MIWYSGLYSNVTTVPVNMCEIFVSISGLSEKYQRGKYQAGNPRKYRPGNKGPSGQYREIYRVNRGKKARFSSFCYGQFHKGPPCIWTHL